LGEGWAVGRFPGQFLRRTELIKRSLRLDDEPTWWCREPLHWGCYWGCYSGCYWGCYSGCYWECYSRCYSGCCRAATGDVAGLILRVLLGLLLGLLLGDVTGLLLGVLPGCYCVRRVLERVSGRAVYLNLYLGVRARERGVGGEARCGLLRRWGRQPWSAVGSHWRGRYACARAGPLQRPSP